MVLGHDSPLALAAALILFFFVVYDLTDASYPREGKDVSVWFFRPFSPVPLRTLPPSAEGPSSFPPSVDSFWTPWLVRTGSQGPLKEARATAACDPCDPDRLATCLLALSSLSRMPYRDPARMPEENVGRRVFHRGRQLVVLGSHSDTVFFGAGRVRRRPLPLPSL